MEIRRSRPLMLWLLLVCWPAGCASWLPPGGPLPASVRPPRPAGTSTASAPAARVAAVVGPHLDQARRRLGEGRPDRAAASLIQALASLPDRSGPLAAEVRWLWGDVEMALERPARAAPHYRAALACRGLTPEDAADLSDRVYLALVGAGDAGAEEWKGRLRRPSTRRLDKLRRQLAVRRSLPATGRTLARGSHQLPPADPADIDPAIRARVLWGARPTGPSKDPMRPITRVTVHHSACCSGTHSAAAAADALRSIQAKHQLEHGWADIGYHFLVDAGGRVWEGRQLRFQGAHAGNPELNVGNIGVCLLGNFELEPLPEPQLRALRELLDSLQGYFELPPRWLVTHKEIRPRPTACPGWALQAVVDRYRSAGTSLALQ